MTALINILDIFITLLAFAILARSLLTWFPIDRGGPIFQALDAITEPILQPLRRIIPPIGMIDITPMVAMFLLFFIAGELRSSA
ncbi:MAG: YggT family protein [Chloroflexi bacterium]|nr:YggT family protein [Chloroflexota bacterium]